MLKAGDMMPKDIIVTDMQKEKVSLDSFLGKHLVLFFYPKDDTIGCTQEACELRDYNAEIEKLGAKVIGISKDNVRSHEKFQEKHKLNFTLLSDPDAVAMKAFDTWQEKKFWGQNYMGTNRATFLIDPNGKILHVWEDVMPLGHGKQVYQLLKETLEKSN